MLNYAPKNRLEAAEAAKASEAALFSLQLLWELLLSLSLCCHFQLL